MSATPSSEMTFWEHIDELRFRIISCLLVFFFTTVLSYLFVDQILHFIRQPIIEVIDSNSNIVEAFKGIMDPFFLSISTSLYSGLFLSLPVIIYSLLRFIFPAIKKGRFVFLSVSVFFSISLFALGAFLSYKVLFPISLQFLITFLPENSDIPLFIFVNEYVSLIFSVTVLVGLVFQLPIVALFLAKLRLVNYQILSTGRKYAILGAFIISAIVTPPDIISQILLSVPMLILYEISILIVKIFNNE